MYMASYISRNFYFLSNVCGFPILFYTIDTIAHNTWARVNLQKQKDIMIQNHENEVIL
jgi:hypothetical protein